ncbi:MAG: M50 family metallopeptidase [Firmicutes bacterium]|nr:M50 family metallopeptidase [Bacillota bacterium]
MLSTLLAVAGLGLLASVHELGHCLAAAASGIDILEFSLGFGPRVVSYKCGRTEVSLRLIPFWAYAAMQDRSEPCGRGYLEKGVLQRIGVCLGGPIASLLLAALAFTTIFSVIGAPQPTTVIGEIMPGLPAEEAGFRVGDMITAVNGRPVPSWDGVVAAFRDLAGTPVTVTVVRDGSPLDIRVTPVAGEGGRGIVGIRPSLQVRTEGVLLGLRDGFSQTLMVAVTWVRVLAAAVMGKVSVEIIGPVGMGHLISQASRGGAAEVVFTVGVFSAMLGLGNLLPLPMFDGGKLVFLVLEAVRGKPVDPQKENLVHAIGLAVFLALGFIILFKDIQRILT